MVDSQQGEGTTALIGPTVFAALSSVLIASALSFLVSQIPDIQLLGWATGGMKQNIEKLTWPAVPTMFFYFRTAFAQAVLRRRDTRIPAESARYRFWRYAFATAFILFAVDEIGNAVLGLSFGVLLAGLAEAGFLAKDLLNLTEIKMLMIILIAADVALLAVMMVCSFFIGWRAYKLTVTYRTMYLLTSMLIYTAFKVAVFGAGWYFGAPGVRILVQSAPLFVTVELFGEPLILLVVAFVAFLLRSALHRVISACSSQRGDAHQISV
jgi:hypothetical protein